MKIPVGMVLGLCVGFVVTLLAGSDSRMTAGSFMCIGGVVAFMFERDRPLWLKGVLALALCVVLAFLWLEFG